MKFTKTKLSGVYILEPKVYEDVRGYFTETWNRRTFEQAGLMYTFVQINTAFNKEKGTLRGMHWQKSPYEETKIVWCAHGAIYDVVIDLRPRSLTYKKWLGVELAADNGKMLYVPVGFAHGYQTLEDETKVNYLVSEYYNPQAATGVKWDDPVFGIDWPLEVTWISEKDIGWSNYYD